MNPIRLGPAALLAAAGIVLVLTLAGPAAALAARPTALADPGAAPYAASGPDRQAAAPANPVVVETLVFSYAAPFVCQAPIPVAAVSYGTRLPLVREWTDVLVHNPNAFAVTFYKKATLAPPESANPAEPGGWHKFDLKPDHAMRVDCDEIAVLLTGDPTATFVGKYGIGVRVQGYVVVAIGPQATPGTPSGRYATLDVTANYARGSEVLKKDIHFQPWWTWWWWPLPWRLAYPYERLLPLGATIQANIDCRGQLYKALAGDVEQSGMEPALRAATLAALLEGERLGPANLPTSAAQPPALVALLGRCAKIVIGTTPFLDVDYILVSNKGPSDPHPIAPMPPFPPPYPWIPGRWYDLAVVLPQQHTIDLDRYLRDWYGGRWIDDGADQGTVDVAMPYFFPWWCGAPYWWGWGPQDCIEIGVGEGESLDVQAIAPARVFMISWPPIPVAGP